MHETLRQHVMAASQRAEVRQAVANVYAALQTEIDRRRPVCNVSGRCCRFEEFGHRLYVTTMELAAFVAGVVEGFPSRRDRIQGSGWDGRGCPFQIDGLCGVHTIRPFGCRIFFCDSTATRWQQEQYERFHAELKRLHQELSVPYFYLEWREALEALEVIHPTPPPLPSPGVPGEGVGGASFGVPGEGGRVVSPGVPGEGEHRAPKPAISALSLPQLRL